MTSAELAQRQADISTEITVKQQRLHMIAEEKVRVLHDEKKLVALEKEESELPHLIAHFQERVQLLAREHEAALTTEASGRISVIEQKYQAIANTLQAQHTEWLAGLEKLAALVEQTQAGKEQLKLLQEESGYLVERFGTPWGQLPPVPTPAQNDLIKLKETFRKSAWMLLGTSKWQEKADALRTAKNLIAHTEADAARRGARSQSLVRSTPTVFTPGGGTSQRGVGTDS